MLEIKGKQEEGLLVFNYQDFGVKRNSSSILTIEVDNSVDTLIGQFTATAANSSEQVLLVRASDE